MNGGEYPYEEVWVYLFYWVLLFSSTVIKMSCSPMLSLQKRSEGCQNIINQGKERFSRIQIEGGGGGYIGRNRGKDE